MKTKFNSKEQPVYATMLPHGAAAEIAREVGVSRTAVSQFLRGKIYSKRIELAVLDYLGAWKKERDAKLRKAGLL